LPDQPDGTATRVARLDSTDDELLQEFLAPDLLFAERSDFVDKPLDPGARCFDALFLGHDVGMGKVGGEPLKARRRGG
ncbi:MAG TPA: hypothetical protein VFR10_06940, partial [bacterium]|nr:hypothetical protein [bacterium]